jgi:hypothetical protein
MKYLPQEECKKCMRYTDRPLCLALAHSGLLVVGYVSQLHDTGESPDKTCWYNLTPAHKHEHKIAVHTFVGPFCSPDPLALQSTESRLKERKVGSIDRTIKKPLFQTELSDF